MKKILMSVSLLLIFANTGFSQKEGADDFGVFSTKQEYQQFMGEAKRAAYGPEGNPELQKMIPMLNDVVLNKPFGFTANKYNTEKSNAGLLENKAVRAEIEMHDYQYEQIRKASSEIQKRAAQEVLKLDFSNTKNLSTRIKSIRKTAQEELDKVLLPHQLKRLRQIQVQSSLQRRSIVDVITNDPLRDELEIDENQTVELRKAEKEIDEELQKEIVELRKKAREKLLSKLKPEQKKKVDELIGDQFEFGDSNETKKNDKRPGKKFKK